MENPLITFFASFLIWAMFVGLFIFWYLNGNFRKEQLFHALFASFLAYLATEIIKVLFPTLRPFEVNGGQVLTLTIPNDGSFPSTHSAIAFGLASSVWTYNKKIGVLFILSAVLVALGRVLGNVHFTVDILVGALLGIGISTLLGKMKIDSLVSNTKRQR